MLVAGSRPNGPTSAGRWMTPVGSSPTAPRSRRSTCSMTTAVSRWRRRAMPVCTTEAALDTLRRGGQRVGLAGTDPVGLCVDVPSRPRQRCSLAARCRCPPHPAVQPALQRQGRTVPPDPETLARRPTSSRHPRRVPNPARRVPFHLQPPTTPPGARATIPRRRLGAAPKSGPADRPLATPTTVHHDTVSPGSVHAGRYTIGVGRRFDGQPALIVITGTDCHVFVAGRLARRLTIKPNHKHQPLNTRRGRPPTVREDPRHA